MGAVAEALEGAEPSFVTAAGNRTEVSITFVYVPDRSGQIRPLLTKHIEALKQESSMTAPLNLPHVGASVPPASPYLTAAEAAIYLRTTVQGVYSLVKRGRLKPMPSRPGRLLFTREALDSYLTGKFRR